MHLERPRTVAFYLPQFHTIPENDEWWGSGFTEWTNVIAASRLFAGHAHPRVPTTLGYYDLRDLDVMRSQAVLAQGADVDAFCFYFYWFDGRRLLEEPVDAYRFAGPSFPYCLSWANEAWSRRWDGKKRDVLMPQSYERGFEDRVFASLDLHFTSPHYLRQHGKPILLVHRADDLPDAAAASRRWRQLAERAGHPGLYLVAAETRAGLDPRRIGFDAVAEFPPVGSNTISCAIRRPVADLAPTFAGRLLDYDFLARRFVERSEPPYVRHRGVAPGWDNTARRGHRATVYVGSSPRSYARWLAAARLSEQRARGVDGLVFINAWNEWAEGAYLEPDELFGTRYLEATRWDTDSLCLPGAERPPVGRWTSAHLGSAARLLAGSMLKRGRLGAQSVPLPRALRGARAKRL